MSDLRVNRVISLNGTSTVEFVTGVSGNADGLRFAPKILQYSPTPLSTDISVTTNQFNITFDQPIEFSGVGTIYIRQGSASGTVYESFTCGVSAGATIAGDTLQINTSAGNFSYFTNYVITLPSVGIANTYGQYYAGGQGYTFRTGVTVFDVQGGDYEQVVVSPTSPTGYYKYNVFTSSGIATFTGPSASATDFAYVLVGGGGGGGGYDSSGTGGGGGGGAGGLIRNYNSNNLPAGVYTVTIGSGGSGTFTNPGGTDAPPTASPSGTWPVINEPGQNSSFGPSPVGTIIAYGGGRAGRPLFYGNPTPSYPYPANPYNTYFAGQPGGSGGGASENGPTSPSPTIVPPSGIPGGVGFSYPSPNQQGRPGGNTFGVPSPIPITSSPAGGGGGGAGGNGGTVSRVNAWHVSGSGGGSGLSNPEFPGPGLAFLGLPVTLTSTMGTPGALAGGGGGSCNVYPSSYPTNPGYFSPPTISNGGPGGGGDGRYFAPPTVPYSSNTRFAEQGVENTGGGGGGGASPGGPTGISPTPASGTWYGASGGSGVMMIRYAHPGV